MEEEKLSVTVDVTLRDNKFFYNIMAKKGMNMNEIMSVLCGAISLSIRSRETPELQGQTLRDIIGHLESEFINENSFSDISPKKDKFLGN
jgi:hypothetical protein